jgi:hypothetical protein
VNGQFIALVQGSQVLVADRNGTIIDKVSGAGAVLNPSISPDGRLVTFLSTGASVSVEVDHGASTSTKTLPAPHGAGPLELYVYDRNTDTITAVTEVAPNGSNSNVQAPASISAADSATQHYKIAFASAATNATVVDATHSRGVFVVELDGSISSSTLDQVTHTTSVIGAGNYQPQITVDGRYVVFTNATTHTAYLYDLATASTVQLGGAGSAAVADLTLNSAASTSGIGIVAALVAVGGTGLTVLDDTALLNSSAGDQHGAAFAAVTEDLAATTLATAGTLPFSDVNLSDVHSVSVTPLTGDPINNPTLGTLIANVAADGSNGIVSWKYHVSEAKVEQLVPSPPITMSSLSRSLTITAVGGRKT